MLRPGAALAALALAALASLTGCGASADGGSSPTSAATSAAPGSPPPSSPPVRPSATSTLTAAEQEAFDQATAAVMAYRQTIADLYSGARTNLNDLNYVATGDLLGRDLNTISKDLRQGYRTDPRGVQLLLVSAEPKTLSLGKKPPSVEVEVCIDATAARAVHPDGSTTQGVREILDYTVVKVDYLPDPGWAVSRMRSDRMAGQRQC